ncbi:MAG: hypothetical protein RL535_878, partial [Pseudomonadota bacterium]
MSKINDMLNIFKTPRAIGVKAVALAFTALVFILPVQHAKAYQIPADAGNAWVVTGSTATKSTPSGLRVNATISGSTLAFSALANTTLMAGTTATGTPVGTFLTPALPAATNGLQILATLAAACQASNPNDLICAPGTLGSVTYTFTDSAGNPIAVRNPVMHISRVGGFARQLPDEVYFGVTHTLTSAGATLGTLSAGQKGLSVTGANIDPVPTATWDGTCVAAANAALAGCGSIPIIGTVSTLSFNIGALRHANAATNAWTTNASAAADAWYVTFSFDEDFGDAPATYQGNVAALATAPASHIQSNLTLGSAWTAANNNSTVLNGTAAGAANFSASPVQVAAGADNMGTNGDGAEENGLSTLAAISPSQIGGTYTLTPTIAGATSSGTVCGWIDFNRDGVFAASEGVCTAFASGATSAALNWTVPNTLVAGTAYVRIRVSYAAMTTSSFNGLLNSGEVEDYLVTILAASDMVPSIFGMPSTASIGYSYYGQYSCTNTAPAAVAAASIGATCAIAGLPAGLTTTCSPAVPTTATVAVGATITCTVTGTPTTAGTYPITVTTGATNDVNGGTTSGGNNSASDSIVILATPTPPVCASGSTTNLISPTPQEVYVSTNTATAVTNPFSLIASPSTYLTPTGSRFYIDALWRWRNGSPALASPNFVLDLVVNGTAYARFQSTGNTDGIIGTLTPLNGASLPSGQATQEYTDYFAAGWLAGAQIRPGAILLPAGVTSITSVTTSFTSTTAGNADDAGVTINSINGCAPPALTVTKTASQTPLVVGQAGQTYTITIAVANGPTTAAIT